MNTTISFPDHIAPSFEKGGLGRICSSPRNVNGKSPSIPLCKRGKSLLPGFLAQPLCQRRKRQLPAFGRSPFAKGGRVCSSSLSKYGVRIIGDVSHFFGSEWEE